MLRQIEELALQLEVAVMDGLVCKHTGIGAYRRLRQIARLAEAGMTTLDRAAAQATLAYKAAVETEILPDAPVWNGEERRLLNVATQKAAEAAVAMLRAPAPGALLVQSGGLAP